jgi:hypothetical protein
VSDPPYVFDIIFKGGGWIVQKVMVLAIELSDVCVKF